MKIVQPIRDKNMIELLKQELLKSKTRDYMLFVFGINTGLRISDILRMKVIDVKNRTHITLTEQKTKKTKKIKITHTLSVELNRYMIDKDTTDFLFPSQKDSKDGSKKAISRIQAYRILNRAANACGIDEEIGTHSLRKTFGYHHYQLFKDVALLQDIFNHSAPSVTLRYIGLNQDCIDMSMDNFGL